MTKSATAVTLALATALTTGCVTTQPETATNTGPNVPRALTSANANASAIGGGGGVIVSGQTNNTSVTKTVPPAVIKWNDESCNKALTENTIKTDDICVRFAVAGTPVATASTAAKPTAQTRQARRAPVEAAAPATSGPAATIYTARVAFSECGVTTSNMAESALQTAGGLAGRVASGIGGLLSRSASNAVGGGVAGRAASEATQGATGSVNQQGRTVAANNNPQSAASAACNAQIANFINGDFKSATAGITADFDKANPGYKATYSVTSELPKVYDNALKAAVGELAPRR